VNVKQQQKQFINMIHGISCYMLPSVVLNYWRHNVICPDAGIQAGIM